jgi:hypothetical protein
LIVNVDWGLNDAELDEVNISRPLLLLRIESLSSEDDETMPPVAELEPTRETVDCSRKKTTL